MQRFLMLASGVVFVSLMYQLYEQAFTAPASIQNTQLYRIVKPQPVTLYVEPDDGMNPVYSAIKSASRTIDMVMYELDDKNVEDDLIAAAARGVSVRILLNKSLYGQPANNFVYNQASFEYLQAHGVAVEWSPASFALTHQKTIVIDNTEAFVMTNNLVSQYYETGRDFMVLDPDENDVEAIEKTFTNDWNDSSSQNTNHTLEVFPGDDLVWSPSAKNVVLEMIASAKHTLFIYNEEMNDEDIENALAAAASRRVDVQVLMTNNSDWGATFSSLENSGVHIKTFAPNAPLYIHAKGIIVDNDQALIGSQNFSESSLENNRELGIFISTPDVISQIERVFNLDWNVATQFQ